MSFGGVGLLSNVACPYKSSWAGDKFVRPLVDKGRAGGSTLALGAAWAKNEDTNTYETPAQACNRALPWCCQLVRKRMGTVQKGRRVQECALALVRMYNPAALGRPTTGGKRLRGAQVLVLRAQWPHGEDNWQEFAHRRARVWDGSGVSKQLWDPCGEETRCFEEPHGRRGPRW